MRLAAAGPLAGLRGCDPGKWEMGEKERGRGNRGWEEKGRGEDREMGGEERGGWKGREENRGRNINLVLD